MRNAIDEVFIGIVHRNCRWHIMKKAHEKLGRLMADDEPLNKAFKDCVDNSLNGIVFPHNTLHSCWRKLHNCAAISNVTMLNYNKLWPTLHIFPTLIKIRFHVKKLDYCERVTSTHVLKWPWPLYHVCHVVIVPKICIDYNHLVLHEGSYHDKCIKSYHDMCS